MERPGQDAALLRAEQFYQDARRCVTEKRHNEALGLLQKALILQPNKAAWHSLQGEIYALLGKADLAAAKFKRALQLDPQDAVANRFVAGSPATGSEIPPVSPAHAALTTPATAMVRQEPGIQDLVLSAAGEEAVMEGAHQVLTRLVQMEMSLKAVGNLGSQLIQQLSALRQDLSRKIQDAFKARRGDNRSLEPLPTAPPTGPAITALNIPPEWQTMPPFQKVIGGTGGVNQGPEVMNLQKVLRHEGFTVQLTGIYDRYTAMAIRQFQEKRGIKPANGILGSETRKVLNLIIGKAQPG